MQILILSSKFPYPLKDGGAIATFQCFKGLNRLANEVHILSFNTRKHFVNKQDIPKLLFPEDSYTLVYKNTRLSFFSALVNLLFSGKPYILQRFKSSDYNKCLKKLLQFYSFDVIQIEGLYMLQYLKVIRKYSDAKIAFRAHNLEHQIWEQLALKERNLLKKAYLRLLARRIFRFEKKCLNKYDLLLPISGEDAVFYQQLGNKLPVKIVPTGFDFEDINYSKTKPGKHRLFYIGSLEWIPNQEGILWFLDKIWPLLKKKVPEIEFHVAGRNCPPWLERKLKYENVTYAGEVLSSAAFMKDKSIMIVPLLSGSGMRIKIIEAFIHSKAVVSTSFGAMGISAVNKEHVLLADKPVDFVENIITLINDEDLFGDLTGSAFTFAKNNFNNEIISKELYEFYQSGIT